MSLLNTRTQYGVISRALHWIIVLAIVVQWLLAEAGEDSGNALALHYSIGFTVLILAVIRLAWVFLNPAPAWPADTKPYEKAIARVVHVCFYALLFAIPLSGWALASVEDEPLKFFGAFDLPRLSLGGQETLEELHEVLFNVLVALAVLHVAGAAKHWITARMHRRQDQAAAPDRVA
jgi:cytochrome b561